MIRVRAAAKGRTTVAASSDERESADDRRARRSDLLLRAFRLLDDARSSPAWIDYNGHMNMAYYHVLFDRAVDEAFGVVGLGPDYVEERNASYFAAEVHTLYKRELKVERPVRVTLQLIDFDEKRLHFYLEIRHATEGWVAADLREPVAPCRTWQPKKVVALPAPTSWRTSPS